MKSVGERNNQESVVSQSVVKVSQSGMKVVRFKNTNA